MRSSKTGKPEIETGTLPPQATQKAENEPLFVFVSHESACEALRMLDGPVRPWPDQKRVLPIWGSCVCGQRSFWDYCSCVDLEAYGLERRPISVLVPSKTMRSRGKDVAAHVWSNALPPQALYRVHPQLLVSSPEFVLVQMAARNTRSDGVVDAFVERLDTEREMRARVGLEGPVPYDDPFEWWRMERILAMTLVACEFMGTYRLPVGNRETRYDVAPLTSKDRVLKFVKQLGRAYGANRLQAALDLCFERSASPMETALALLLSLPVQMGGYGLPRPELNANKDTQEYEAVVGRREGVRPDLLWEDARLVVEYDSDEFHAEKGSHAAARDARHANALTMMGYTVLRVTTAMLKSAGDCDLLAAQVASRLGMALERPDEPCLMRRTRLRGLLLALSG